MEDSNGGVAGGKTNKVQASLGLRVPGISGIPEYATLGYAIELPDRKSSIWGI